MDRIFITFYIHNSKYVIPAGMYCMLPMKFSNVQWCMFTGKCEQIFKEMGSHK